MANRTQSSEVNPPFGNIHFDLQRIISYIQSPKFLPVKGSKPESASEEDASAHPF
jgi:hypothetical protein